MKKKEDIHYVGIGIFIFLGIILFLVGIYFAGKYSYKFSGGYKLNVEYSFVDNLTPRSKVRVLGGKDIGFVDDIQFKGDRLNIVLAIEGKYKINRSATFHIYSTGVVGTKYISVENFNPNEGVFFKDGEVITGRSPVGMSQMMDSFGDLIASVMGDTQGEIIGNVSSTFNNIGNLVNNLNKLVLENEQDIKSTVSSLKVASRNLALLSGSFTNIDPAKISRIVNDLEATTKQLHQLSDTLNTPDGLLSLAKDRNLAQNIKSTIKNLEEFTAILKNKPNSIVVGK